MGNGAYGLCGTGDNGIQGYGVQEVWVTGGMGHMGNEAHMGMGYRGIGYMGNRVQGVRVQGYGAHGQWGT